MSFGCTGGTEGPLNVPATEITGREPMQVEPPKWAEWLAEKDAEIARLRQQIFGDDGLVQEVADLQAKGERVEAERDDYKRQLDWAHDALDKIGAPRFPNDYPCSPEQDAYRGRDTGGAYLAHGRIVAYVNQAKEELEAVRSKRDEVLSQVAAMRDSQRALDETHRQLQAIELCCDAAQDRVKELEAERDDYKRQLDWAHDALDKIGAPRFPNDYPCSPEQDAYRGRDTGGAYLAHGRIVAYVNQAKELLNAAHREQDAALARVKEVEQELQLNAHLLQKLQLERDVWKNVCQMASDNTEYLDAETVSIKAERDAALAKVGEQASGFPFAELEQELRLKTRMLATQCDLVRQVEADCAVMREFVSAARDWEEPKEDAEDWKVKHDRYYLCLKKALALLRERSPLPKE